MDIPALWCVVLREVQKSCPGAIIAGGALRDLDNDAPVKDVDIFFPCADVGKFAKAIAALEATQDIDTGYVAGDEYRENFNDVVGVAKFEVMDTTFEIIGIDLQETGVSRIIDRFDLGICQISYAGEHIERTLAYITDQRVRQFTFLKPYCLGPKPFHASLKRWNRLQAKYAGWPLVIAHTWDDAADDIVPFEMIDLFPYS